MSINKKIILLEHHDNPRDDLATTHLANLGFELDVVCPFQGQLLPEVDHSIHGVVVYGGEHNVTEMEIYPFLRDEAKWIRQVIETEIPVLGICLGAQLIAHALGAKVELNEEGLCEFGYYRIEPTTDADHWFDEPMYVAQAHYQQFELPKGAVLLATGENFVNQAFRFKDKVFGFQFHPEVTSSIFQRWQNSDWAYFDKKGAQTREEQCAIMDDADKIQADWFREFLEKLFINETSMFGTKTDHNADDLHQRTGR